MANRDPRKNSEGYYDLTAYKGAKPVYDANNAATHEASRLIQVLKYIIDRSGFELIGRIEIRDRKTGKVFK